MGPEALDQILNSLSFPKDPRILVGPQTSDDAGVYQLTEEIALVQTVDFFTPIVDDAYTFGQIAVANALSDVYAMGGSPLTAMNLVAFPTKKLPLSILKDILLGGLSKMTEAGVALVGGHSIEDPEMKYGLAVTGIVHPSKILTNAKARPGDCLILTKPLGTGIIATALKGGVASKEAAEKIIKSMVGLNRNASELLPEFGVHACTDVTGFGLIGHALEMGMASKVGMRIRTDSVPIFPEAVEYARRGLIPGGAHSNQTFFSCRVDRKSDLAQPVLDVLNDPQTSGGLLISVPPRKAEALVRALRESGAVYAAGIGEVFEEPQGKLEIL